MPFLREFCEFGGVGEIRQPVGSTNCIADAKITDWHDVGPLQREDEEHLRGPDAHASYLRQECDNFFVRQITQLAKVELPARNMLGQIGQGGDFLTREPAGAQLLGREFQESRGCEAAPDCFSEAVENRSRGLPTKLLERNGAGQRLERWLSECNLTGSHALDDPCQNGIGVLEMQGCMFHCVAESRR